MIWREAFEFCEENGLKLGQIESEAEANFLYAFFGNSLVSHWVSAKDFWNDGDLNFEWDSVGVHMSHELLWSDNAEDGDSGYCGAFTYLAGVTVFPFGCTGTRIRTLCQGNGNYTDSPTRRPRAKPKAKVAKVKGQVEWIHWGDVEGKGFYSLSNSRVNWENAFDLCEQGNMTLARVESQIQADFLGERVKESGEYWIASRDIRSNFYDRVWNNTGAYSKRDIDWSEGEKVEGPGSICLYFFYKETAGPRAQPKAFTAYCLRNEFEFLCTKKL